MKSQRLLMVVLTMFLLKFAFGQGLVASFSSNITSGCSPITVRFTDLSTGGVTAWSWNFGNGVSSSLSNPTAVYAKPGIYKVRLDVVDPLGGSSFFESIIRVYSSPKVSITANLTEICQGQEVQFKSTITKADAGIKTILWDFGDGTSSYLANPPKKYLNSGQFTVKILATDSNNCKADTSYTNLISSKRRPVARFVIDTIKACSFPLSIAPKNNTSTVLNNYFKWDFGDGQTQLAYDPTHIYTAFGNYDVTLIAGNSLNCFDTLTKRQIIELKKLTVTIIADPEIICEGEKVALKAEISPKLNEFVSFKWTLPDGSSRQGANISQTLNKGNVTFSVAATSSKCNASDSKAVTVNEKPERKIFIVDKTLCGKQIITIESQDANTGDIVDWLIGNTKKTGVKTNYLVEDPGKKIIEMKVKDINGCTNTFKDSIFASFAFLSTRDTGMCITRNYTPKFSYKPSGSSEFLYPLTKIVWNSSDFSINNYEGSVGPTISINKVGQFSFQLEAVDSIGCIYNNTILIGGGAKPKMNFNVQTKEICSKGELHLIGEVLNNIAPVDYSWFMGSTEILNPLGGNIYKRSPIINPGLYDVKLIGSNFGCKDTITKNEQVKVNGAFIGLNIYTDSCIGTLHKTTSNIQDYDSAWWTINNEYKPYGGGKQDFQLLDKDKLSLIALNRKTGCSDRIDYTASVSDDPYFFWDIAQSGCIPAKFQIKHQWELVDSIRWYINDLKIGKGATNSRSGLDTFQYEIDQTGVLKISVIAYTPRCDIRLDTSITLSGPVVKPRIGRLSNCFPQRYLLIDSFYNAPMEKRYWIIDGDSIPSSSIDNYYTLSGVRNPENNIIVIKLVAERDSCGTFFQYNFVRPGLPFSTKFEAIPANCTEADFTFLIDVPSDKLDQVSVYEILLKDTVLTSLTPIVKARLFATGLSDTALVNVIDKNGCKSTQRLFFNRPIAAVQAKFATSDTIVKCPPIQIQMKDLSVAVLGEIVQHEWFIDGKFFSNVSNPTRLFTQPAEHTIALKVTDNFGCSDSISVNKALVIQGVPARINIPDYRLCLGDSLIAKLETNGGIEVLWDMQNGQVIKGNKISYRYPKAGKYLISVLISDATDCQYLLPAEDSVRIFDLPKADFEILKKCKNDSLVLKGSSVTNNSTDTEQWRIFNTDFSGNIVSYPTSVASPLAVFYKITDTVGCVDSIKKEVSLFSVETSVTANKKYYCLGDSILLNIEVKVDTNYLVEMSKKKGGNAWLSTTSKELATEEGIFDIRLIAKDVSQCIDTFIAKELVKVAGANLELSNTINLVSVLENNEVSVTLEKVNSPFFSNYEIRDPLTKTLLWQSDNVERNSTSLMNRNPQEKAVCVVGGVNTGCKTPNYDLWPTHCTINTSGEPQKMARKINWTPYVGWSVNSYAVYRQEEGLFKLLATVSGNQNYYIDSQHLDCDKPQKYKVAAYGDNLSFSDTCQVSPIWEYEFKAPFLQNISVVNDSYIEILADTSYRGIFPLKELILAKNTNGNIIKSTQIIRPMLTDRAVFVDSLFYSYKIQAKDVCNSLSIASNEVQSLLLKADIDLDNKVILEWNAAAIWQNGISSYQIQRKTGINGFETIATLTNINTTSYIDLDALVSCGSELCYRMLAVSADNTHFSYSNEVCNKFASRLFIPNAVTPNFDALNETFQPLGLFIKNYKMQIFNRGGQLLFTTDNCLEGWNCKINGNIVPSGVYVYFIEALGMDDRRFILNGNFTVLK